MKRIELSPEEITVIKQQLNCEIEVWSATDEQQKYLTQVIDKATEYMREFAPDEQFDDLIQWYWDKYQSQEQENK